MAIDILRGLAILWVISFHLSVDMAHSTVGTDQLYVALRDRIAEGNALGALTAFVEVVLGTGYYGVVLFMVLSGLSLTMHAYGRGEARLLSGYRARIWKILPVYWSGIAFLAATFTIIALLQVWLDGGTFGQQWHNVRIAASYPITWNVEPVDALWSATVFAWIFRGSDVTALMGSTWFVALLIQYYLVFPFALRLLNRIGPWRFMLAAIVFTAVSRGLMIRFGPEFLSPDRQVSLVLAGAPFRFSEFAAGMTIGWLLVHRREETAEYVRSPLDTLGVVVIALLLLVAGAVVGPKSDMTWALGDPVIGLGIAVLTLPLLFKAPGWIETSLPARALIFMGVISFPVLIVNDGMRYLASFLRLQEIPDPTWWFFLIVVYVPVGVLLAYPYALLFGLVPKQRRKRALTAARDAQPAPLDAQPAVGGG